MLNFTKAGFMQDTYTNYGIFCDNEKLKDICGDDFFKDDHLVMSNCGAKVAWDMFYAY